jgi:WD40 repeat protein
MFVCSFVYLDKGSVNDVDFSPNPEEPIIASGSSDGTIYLGEIKK